MEKYTKTTISKLVVVIYLHHLCIWNY